MFSKRGRRFGDLSIKEAPRLNGSTRWSGGTRVCTALASLNYYSTWTFQLHTLPEISNAAASLASLVVHGDFRHHTLIKPALRFVVFVE